MILHITTVLNLIASLFPVHIHGGCAPNSCERTPAGMRTSVVLSLTSTRDPPYVCHSEEIEFSCEVINGISLQWVSEPDIPCNRPLGYTMGDDEGETRTRGSYHSHLVPVAQSSSNLRSVLTFTPARSMDSVTVVCGDQLSLCPSTEAEHTVNVTDTPPVTERSLQHYFSNSQESCPNVSVTIEIEEIQDVAPLTYKLNVSSSDGCALEECPMFLSPGERILNITLMDGLEYTASLTVSNDCGSDSTTLSIHPVCEPRATTDPPPETPTYAATIVGALVGAAIGSAVVGAVAGAIFVAVCIACYRKKKKKDSVYELQAVEDLEQRSHRTEKVKMKEDHEKELQTLKVKMKEDHEKELQTLKVKMKEDHEKELQTLEGDHQRRLQEVQDPKQRRQPTEKEEELWILKEEHERELQALKEKIKRIHERARKRSRRRRHILLQDKDVPESSPALSGSITSGATEYPLHMAAKKGNLDKVKRLVDEGADINIKDNNERTALHVAVERTRTEIVKYLVDREADITIKDDNGMTPFHVAAERGRCEEILGYLIDKGGDKSMNITDEDGRTPLHVAVRGGLECTVEFLVNRGADLTIQDYCGMTPFHAAAKRGRCEKVLGLLIDKGGATCINIKDEDGRTPLHVAVEEGQECTVESLVEKFEADINSNDIDGMTPLHVAVERGDRINIMKYLLNKGADINVTDSYGRTPIHIAAKEGHEYSVRTLVKKGADISIKDDARMTPRDLADESGHVNIKTFLEEERSPEKIAEFPRNINMMDGMKVWKEGDNIRMTVYEDNETMYDLQGSFEAVGDKIVGLHLHNS